MSKLRNSLLILLSALAFACEEEFIPEVAEGELPIVVEGYIEGGEDPVGPFVILTRSLSFFSSIDAEGFEDIFIHDAKVEVSDGTNTIELTEFCLKDLTPQQQALAGDLFGFDPDSIGFNFCTYIDLSFSMEGEIGKTYTLNIEVGEEKLSAVTTIPNHIPLDSLLFQEPPGEPSDTLAQLICYVSDPAGEANFYRYFTSEDNKPFEAPFTSVTDDRLFDGDQFRFPLAKAEPFDREFDPVTFGLFNKGDTVGIKWMNIDEAHFNFWNTLEFSATGQGNPFSSYTRISSNIDGGVGIWGGLSASYYELIVPQ